MKKIQLVFAMVAVLAASAGVLGNALLPPDLYFQETSVSALDCVVPAEVDPCITGDEERCVVDVEGTDLYISKKVGGAGPCIEHERPM